MRVVLDANVLVSAALKNGSVPARAAFAAAIVGTLLKSEATEAQILGVLARPKLASIIAPAAMLRIARLVAFAEMVRITERAALCRDPSDDMFLELAINGSADVIVSGDADLLVLNPFRGIPILSPGAFIRSFLAGGHT